MVTGNPKPVRVRSLRKGSSSVYLQYANVGDSIEAEKFDIGLLDGALVLAFTLRPVDSNQREDEDHLHKMRLLSVQIMDERVATGLRRYCALHSHEITKGMRLEIISRMKKLTFEINDVRDDCFVLA
ncbi:MAG: hypothetical protein ABSD88_02560 [Candidatus Korobacteraceae bacterium]|jgi:hypothetical protein